MTSLSRETSSVIKPLFILNVQRLLYFRGISVLNTKSELEKAFAKHKKNLNEKRKEQESPDCVNSEFQKMIAERAKRLEKVCWCLHNKMLLLHAQQVLKIFTKKHFTTKVTEVTNHIKDIFNFSFSLKRNRKREILDSQA